MVRRDLNANFSDGYARWFNDGDTMWGITGPAGHESVRMGLRPIAGAVVAEAAGIHNFLGTDPHGRGINLYSVAFTGDVFYSTPVSLDVLSDATTRMGQMQPAELLWALGCNNMTITYGAPRLISEMAEIVRESARTLLLEVFSQLGKAAAIVAADSRLLLLNPQAEVLWAEQPLGRRASIQLHRSGDQGALDQLVKSAARGRGGMLDLSPIAVERPDGRPILIQAMPVDQAVAGQAAALLLFSDPASPQAASPVRALQLLGLTPAEARIAGLVGAGRSPREAAGTLRLTVNTVRSTLKVAYEKLGITRQSELAKLVVRLAG